MATPFHISMIKNVSRNEEGHHTYLRINLFCPGLNIIKQNGGVNYNPDTIFVKEVSFRGTHEKSNNSAANLDYAFRMIKVSFLFFTDLDDILCFNYLPYNIEINVYIQ